MKEMIKEKPFWETAYLKSGTPTAFNAGKPSLDVVDVLENRLSKGSVLDLGCGDGRNALYAACLGYDVTATDISEAGIDKLKRLAEEMNVSINATVEDMRAFKGDKSFDVIITHGCLHLLAREEWKKVLDNILVATAPNGFNITVVFTNTVPAPPDMEPFFKGLFNEGELYEYYSDWIIHYKESHIFEDDHDGGIHHAHAVNRVIAQKRTK